MKTLTQTQIAEKLGKTQQRVSQIINGEPPKWQDAKKLSEVVPNTTPQFWMEATPEQKRQALQKVQ